MTPTIIWDLEDDREGNWWHIVVEGHGIAAGEVAEVLEAHHAEATLSRSSGQSLTFGWTSLGHYIAVVYEHVSDDPLTFYPITAYEAPPPRDGTENNMAEQIHRRLPWTPEDRRRHQEIRERFQRERPSLEQLVASGEFAPPIPQGVYLEILRLCANLRRVREASGMELSELAARTGLDVAVWQRLEGGGPDALTVELVLRYAQALGKRLVWRLEDADDPAAAAPAGH